MFDLTGRVALVTGAGRGAGAGIASALSSRGAIVAVNDLVPARAAAVADDLVASGARSVPLPFDVTDPDAVGEAIGSIPSLLGGHVEILVNNAGVPEGMALASFRDMPPADWRRYVDLNLYGSLHCIKSTVDPMIEAGWGRIVQISSGAGRTGIAFGVSLYGASKSGIEGFVRHLSQELAPTGVTVNTLALGLLCNAVPEGAGDGIMAAMAATVPVGRLGQPDDVGAAVVYLASDEAAWMTGQTLNLNGGSTTS